uniref:Uncharacterized protein n=1 Tax=Romanomermis culicivorax TaxID=13658 RepID=A0A915KZY6_ROMCU
MSLRYLQISARRQFQFNFCVNELVLPKGYGIVLFISLVKFIGEDGSRRFYTPEKMPIRKVTLNDAELEPIFNDGDDSPSFKALFLEPLNMGANRLTVSMQNSEADFVRLAIQANTVLVAPPSDRKTPTSKI